jgi:hypothetical protein
VRAGDVVFEFRLVHAAEHESHVDVEGFLCPHAEDLEEGSVENTELL